MEISIRQMNKDDFEVFQKLNHEVFLNDKKHVDDLNTNWPFEEIGIRYFKNVCSGELGIGFIAEHEGNPVGYIAINLKEFNYRKRKYVEVSNMGVTESYRSKGIGSKLLAKAKEWAKQQKADRLYVSAFAANKRAIAFYKEFGFSEIGIELDMDI